MSFEIVENILSAHRGSKFYKTDLHVHTPASKDWDEKNKPEFSSANITADQVVQAGLNAGLDVIAITDHNSVEWCEPIIEAAKETELTVFPGFELTARPGVHILSIFPQEKPINDIRNLLIKLGITDFGNPLVMTEETVENISSGFKIIRSIREEGGLVIPAHIDIDSGIVGRLKGGIAVKEFLKKHLAQLLK